MSSAATRRRPTVAARRTGYLVSVVINGALLYVINRRPGWDALPFLTADTEKVLGLVNASILVGLAANVVYLFWDPPRLRALGDLATTSVGLAAMIRMWQVFPFSFEEGGFPWDTLLRWLLGVGIVGSVIGIVVSVVAVSLNKHR